jgi:ligand-binding sensor domain-containing protein/GGDEF domain-containing protein
LSHSGVLQINQDKDGYIWVATEDGLNRFDGKNFVQFFADANDPFSISRSMVTAMYKDPSERMWLGTKNGLAYIDSSGKKFINLDLDFAGDNPHYVVEITAAEKNNLWLLGVHDLWHFDSATQTLMKMQEPKNSISDLEYKNVDNFYGDGSGSLIVGSKQGIFKLSSNQISIVKIPNFPGTGREIKKINVFQNEIWVVTINNIYHYNILNKIWFTETFNSPIKSLGFTDVVYENGRIWAASSAGLWLKNFDCQCWNNYVSDQLVENSLKTNTLTTLYVDKQSQLWIGSQSGGISVRNPKSQIIQHWLNRRQLANFLDGDASSSVSVTDIKPAQDGGFYVATDDRGYFKLSNVGDIVAQYTAENTSALHSNYINQLHLDLNNNLWLTSFPFGLQVKKNSGDWIELTIEKMEYIFEIYEDRNGKMWVGTLEGAFQVELSENNSINVISRPYPEDVMKHGSRTNVIYQSLNGFYWFGTEAGLVVMDQQFNTLKVFSELDSEQPILSNSVNDITEGAAGDIWIATGSGLNQISYSNNQWAVSKLEKQPLLNSKTLLMVDVDLDRNLWVAGSNGLFRVNTINQQVTYFSEKTGIQGLEFGLDASYIDKNGNLYFGGINGVSVLPPSYTVEDDFKSPIQLFDVKINGFENINSISSLSDGSFFIPAETKIARLYFDVINLDSTSTQSIRFRIPEFTDKWLPWTEDRHFDLFELPAGNITIQVQAMSLNNSKIIADQKFRFEIESNYSFYDYIFWILLILITIGLVFYLKKQSNSWEKEKKMLINSQLSLTETVSIFKDELAEKNQQQDLLLDELAIAIKENTLLENQINDLHLVDKQTGLHTKEFISLSIDVLTRKILESYNSRSDDRRLEMIPEPLLLIIKLDNFEELRLEGGQFLITQMVIQIAAEIKKVCVNTDELVKWNSDSFLLYSRNEPTQQVLGKCKKIVEAIDTGLFGPSESEKFSVTATVTAIKYPFLENFPDVFDWPVLLDLANAAACHFSKEGGNRYQYLGANSNPNLLPITIEQMEQCINDFSIAQEHKWIEILS